MRIDYDDHIEDIIDNVNSELYIHGLEFIPDGS